MPQFSQLRAEPALSRWLLLLLPLLFLLGSAASFSPSSSSSSSSPSAPSTRVLTEARPLLELGACGEFDKTTRMYHIMDYVAKIALEQGFLDAAVPSRNFDVRIQSAATMCLSAQASPLVLPLLLGQGLEAGRIYSETENISSVKALSGCSCSSVSTIVSQLAAPLEVPMVSGASTSADLSNKALHPYFARTCSPDSMQGAGLAALVAYFGKIASWKRVALFYDQETYGEGIADAFASSSLVSNFTLYREPLEYLALKSAEQAAAYDPSSLRESLESFADLRPLPRIFVIAVMHLQPITRIMDESGLFVGSSLVFTADESCDYAKLEAVNGELEEYYEASLEEGSAASAAFWKPGSYNWTRTPSLVDGMMCLLLNSQGDRYKSDEWKTFWSSLTREQLLEAGMPSSYYTDPAWFEDFDMLDAKIWYPLIFDAMTSIFIGISVLLDSGVAASEIGGAALLAAILAANFEGLSGTVAFDANGDRLAPYDVMNLQTTAFATIGLYNSAKSSVKFDSTPLFGSSGSTVPADVPDTCPAGSEYNKGECTLCSPGSATAGNDVSCASCPAGTYAATEGATGCTAAPAGGFVATAGATEYAPCPAGHYTSTAGSSECQGCSAGFYSSLPGQTDCTWCAKGTYTEEAVAASACSPCAEGRTTREVGSTAVTDCVCEEGSYDAAPTELVGGSGACLACPDGLSCAEGSLDRTAFAALELSSNESSAIEDLGLAFPEAKPGYMIMSKDPLQAYLCLYEEQCPGGSPDVCASQRDSGSVACGDCLEGSYQSAVSCRKCDGAWDLWPTLVAAILAVILVSMGINFSTNDALKGSQSSQLCIISLGLTMTSMQTLGIFDQLNVVWFEPIATIASAMRLVSFDLKVLKGQCWFGSDPLLEYAIRQLLLPAGLVWVVIVVAVKKRFTNSDTFKRRAEVVNAAGGLLQTFFISVVVSCVAPFVCYNHPGPYSSMRSSPSTLCWEEGNSHHAMVALGSISFLLVPLPFLALVVYGTLRYRKLSVSSSFMWTSLRFLYARFQPQTFFYLPILLIRSLAICFIPVIFDHAPTQILLLCGIFSVFGMLQAWLQPWRGVLPNFADATASVALILVLVCGAMLAGLQASTGSVELLGLLSFLLLASCTLGLLVVVLGKLLLAGGPAFDFFVCHHKSDAAGQARLLKMVLAKSTQRYNVFIDSDNLKDLDTLFNIVKVDVKTLLVYLTSQTLRRPWCAGEVTTALLASKAKVIAIKTTSFRPPSNAELEDPASYVDATACCLQQYSINWVHVTEAFSLLLSETTAMIDLGKKIAAMSDYRQLAAAIVVGSSAVLWADHLTSKEPSDELPLKPGQVVISADSSDPEATAAAGILALKLRSQGAAEVIAAIHEGRADEFTVAHCVQMARAVIVLLSEMTLRCPIQLTVIAEAMQARHDLATASRTQSKSVAARFTTIKAGSTSPASHDKPHQAQPQQQPQFSVVPLLLPRFRFPDELYYSKTLASLCPPEELDELAVHVQSLFKLIAVMYSTDASDQILDVQSSEVALRIQPIVSAVRGTVLAAGMTQSLSKSQQLQHLSMAARSSGKSSQPGARHFSEGSEGQSSSLGLAPLVPSEREAIPMPHGPKEEFGAIFLSDRSGSDLEDHLSSGQGPGVVLDMAIPLERRL